jgi:hypothetical protein
VWGTNKTLCVCVCVCVWEREREREIDFRFFFSFWYRWPSEMHIHKFNKIFEEVWMLLSFEKNGILMSVTTSKSSSVTAQTSVQSPLKSIWYFSKLTILNHNLNDLLWLTLLNTLNYLDSNRWDWIFCTVF